MPRRCRAAMATQVFIYYDRESHYCSKANIEGAPSPNTEFLQSLLTQAFEHDDGLRCFTDFIRADFYYFAAVIHAKYHLSLAKRPLRERQRRPQPPHSSESVSRHDGHKRIEILFSRFMLPECQHRRHHNGRAFASHSFPFFATPLSPIRLLFRAMIYIHIAASASFIPGCSDVEEVDSFPGH